MVCRVRSKVDRGLIVEESIVWMVIGVEWFLGMWFLG